MSIRKKTTPPYYDYEGGGKYVALLTQSGTGAPTAVVIVNTLEGTIIWTRTGVGEYSGTLAGAFKENKTGVITGGILGGTITSKWDTEDNVRIETDFGGAYSDDLLGTTTIEITVYP